MGTGISLMLAPKSAPLNAIKAAVLKRNTGAG